MDISGEVGYWLFIVIKNYFESLQHKKIRNFSSKLALKKGYFFEIYIFFGV